MSFFSNFGRTRGRRRSNLNLTVEFRTLSITAGDKDKSKGYNKDYRHVDYHQLTVDEIKTRFNSDLIHGLTENYTVAILEKSGKNVISPPPSNRFSKFIEYTFGGFGILLWISAIISFLAYQPLGGDHADPTNIGLGVLLLIVVLIQIGFNAYQDYCSSKIMDSIKDMLPASATVIRDGVSKVIPASDLVVGDLVQIKYGNKIPADLRITQSSDLKLDKSILSGESEAVKCTTETSSDNYLESKNIALMGTLATNGSGMGVVVQTGDQTVMGTLTKLSSQTKMSKTLLQKEIDRFVFIIASISITSSALVLLVWGVWLKVSYPTFLSLSGILVNVIGVLVAFTPAGLPVAVTLTLTLIARKMVANKVLVKNLNTVETLGSVDVLASDKTGTLTQNKMSVVNAITDRAYSSAEWDELYVGQDPRFIQLATIASLCNGAQFDPSDLGLPIADRKVNGDATDTGILRFAESFKPNQVYLEEYRKLDEIPFNSKNKWMLSIYRPQAETNVFNSQDRILMIKGAPDILLPKCNYVLSSEGKETALTEELRNTIINEQMVASSQGQRVILLARAFLNDDKHADPTTEGFLETVHNLCVVGQVGIIDPPRDGIADVINTFKRAGIRTIMVTGDFALTAAAIARQIDILTAHSHDTLAKMRSINESEIQICIHSEKDPHSSKRALILAGSELNELTTLDWDKVCRYPEIVFARTTPEQKLKIVQEFQSRDHIVAVTGDGVNDSPALKNADVGIAMGGGSQVAIEAAHMVLLDSNFASILVAIENGRLVFDNLKKVILYLLPAGSFSEMIPILVNVILGSPIPLSPFFMIVICVLTDIFSSMAIMCEKPESNLLLRSPRRPKKDRLTDRNLLIHAYAFLGIQETMYAHIIYFTYMRLAGGFSPFQVLLTFSAWSEGYLNHTQEQLNEYAFTGQSIFFVSLVVMQAMGNLFSSRVRRVSTFKHNPFYGPGKNPYLFAAIISSLGIALIIIYVPFFNTVFNTRPIQVQYWFIPLGFAMLILLTEETRKYFVRNYPNSIVGKLAW